MNIKSKLSVYLIYLCTAILVITVNYYDYYQNKQTVYTMLVQKGKTLCYFLQQTTENAILSIDNLEQNISDRLQENTALAAELAATGQLTEQNLSSILNKNPLSAIGIVENDRLIIAQGNFSDFQLIKKYISEFKQSGEKAWLSHLVESADSSSYFFALSRVDDQRVAVGITDGKRLKEVYQKVGLNRLLDRFVQNDYLIFAAIQDEKGIISATRNVDSLGSIVGDSELETVLAKNQPLSRIREFSTQQILEIADVFYVDERKIGLLRLGLNMQPLQEIYLQMRYRSILIILLLLAGAFVVIKLVEHREQAILLSRSNKFLESELVRKNKLLAIENLASGVAHEIRNPLNGISTLLQQLIWEYRPAENSADFDSLGTILQSEIRRLNQIVENFLNYARPYQVNPTRFAAQTFWAEISPLIQEEIKQKSITLQADIADVEIQADYSGLKQILLNLLKNSIEAIDLPNCRIQVAVYQEKEQICLKVIDTGSGIIAENLKNIFNPYFTTKSGGNGLGLAIAAKIIAEHGGTITASSESAKKTEFEIRLPVENGILDM